MKVLIKEEFKKQNMNVCSFICVAVILAVILIGGCSQYNSKPATQKTRERITNDVASPVNEIAEAKKEPSIILTLAPEAAVAGESFKVSWDILSEPSTTQHTAVHYGPESVPDPKGPKDYPMASRFQCTGVPCNIPDSFSAAIIIEPAGKYYYRAHTIANGQDVWSEEKEVVVFAGSKMETAGIKTADFEIDADDFGFYMEDRVANNYKKIDALNVGMKTKVAILFKVSDRMSQGVLQFKGCGVESEPVDPGKSSIFEFSPGKGCTIESYRQGTTAKRSSFQVESTSETTGGYSYGSGGGGGGGGY